MTKKTADDERVPRDYTESGYKAGAARLGIDPDEYRRWREAGFRWCGGHRRFEPATKFRTYKNAGTRSDCIESERTRARESQRRRREAVGAVTRDETRPPRFCAQCGQAFERSSHGGRPSRCCSKPCRLAWKQKRRRGAA